MRQPFQLGDWSKGFFIVPMTPEELEALVRRVVREELERIEEKRNARQRKRRSREKTVMSHNVTPMSRFPQENVTLGHAPVTLNGHKVGYVTVSSGNRDIGVNGSSPLSPPQTPPLTPPIPKKKVYVNHDMVVERCKKLKFSDMIDFAWGKVRTGSYYGKPIEDEDDFRGVMAEILEKWKSC